MLSFEIEVNGSFEIDNIDLITAKDLEAAAETGLALVKLRIQKGMRADGKPIKEYSNGKRALKKKATSYFEPRSYDEKAPEEIEGGIYIPLKGVGTGNPMAKPKGGRDRHKVTGKKMKSMFFPGGYKEFREKSGRGSSPVNLTLSGNTTGKRFRVISRTNTQVIVGWPSGSLQAIVASALDARDQGMVFTFSQDEQESILEVLQASIIENLQAAGVPATDADVRLVQITKRQSRIT